MVSPPRLRRRPSAWRRKVVSDQVFDPVTHFFRGFVGEGYREDMPRIDLFFFDQVGDAPGEDAGFAGAGAGQNEDGALGRLDRGLLLVV